MKRKENVREEPYSSPKAEKSPDPCAIVIFGASGDLAHRKLLPALYDLYCTKRLPKNFLIVGVSRKNGDDNEFRKEILSVLKNKTGKKQQSEFIDHLYYRTADPGNPDSFRSLSVELGKLQAKHKTAKNTIFYFAIPPSAFGETVLQLHRRQLIQPARGGSSWTRIVFEKPFGHDLESSRLLDSAIRRHLDESQIYRIDHYLGKETVQNILMFRFANSIFEPIWNRQYIDHVQIMASEKLGVEHRAAYYDEAGALRDMFQNHMFQLLTLCTMEPPVRFASDQYHDEKAKVLRALRPIPKGRVNDFVVRGQYGRGRIDRRNVPEYRKEEGVDPKSAAETFVAMKLFIDNWRWHGVPFFLRSGKRLNSQDTEIMIKFKQIHHSMFSSLGSDAIRSNILCFRIQPDEGISLRFGAKRPGPELNLASLNLDFDYKTTFPVRLMGPYERLLLDCMHGDQTLFVREDTVDLSWQFITAILKEWEKSPPAKFPNYESGSWGPEAANRLIREDGRKWRTYGANYSRPTDSRGKKL